MNKFCVHVFLSLLFLSDLQAQVAFTDSNLPIIMIETEGREIVDEPKVFSTLKIIDNGPGNRNNITDTPNDYDGFAGIELRGQSSQHLFDKKSYGIELRTQTNADTSASILGMPGEEDWVLHGPYSDKSLMRNFLAFHLWSEMGRYGSRTRFCEVQINGDYKGLYVLMEKIKRDSSRVAISKLQADENTGDDLTGGYILKLDKTNPGKLVRGWNSEYKPPLHTYEEQNIFFQIEYPKPEKITDHQFDYIRSYVTAFENSLARSDLSDPVTGYTAFADIESFIDYAIFTEINKNIDGYRLSTFLHKDKDSKGGKLKMGPPWDYNLAFGNADYCAGSEIQSWAWDFNKICPQDYWLIPFWWNKFRQDSIYIERFKARWLELRAEKLATSDIHHFIDSIAGVIDEAQQRNFQRWPVLGQYIWPNSFVGATYQAEINYLKSWVQQRMNWMDNAVSDMEVVVLGGIPSKPIDLLVFPNPATRELEVRTKKLISSYQILDLQGRVLLDQDVHPQQILKIDISSLKSGNYIFRGISGGKYIQQLFIKN